jgi:predicted glycosyltransferase
VQHTGFVVAPAHVGSPRPAGRLVLASAGGGSAGEPLLTTALQAQSILAAEGFTLRAIAGPLLPADGVGRLAAIAAATPGAELVRVVPDLGPELARAAVSVSQCGYNTALEVVAAGIPAIVVPFGEGLEDEQRRRAGRLATLGAVSVLETSHLTPSTLAAAVRARCGQPVAPVALTRDGARCSAALLEAAIGVPT